MKFKITFDELEEMGYPSVTDWCRALVSHNNITEEDTIEVYRGDMLCLTVTDIKAASGLYPDGVGFKKYRPDRYEKAQQSRVKRGRSDLNG